VEGRDRKCGVRRAACASEMPRSQRVENADSRTSCSSTMAPHFIARRTNRVPDMIGVPHVPVGRTPHAARAPRGFTLIEVLAALVIVSLGMMAVIQAVSQTASNSSYLRDKTIAHWVAMNRLTEVRLEQGAPKVDKTSDEVEMAGREWRWTMEVTQTPVETMRRIDISVRPADGQDGSSMASITGFYGSAIAPPGSALVLWEGLPKGAKSRNPGRDDNEGDEGSEDGGDGDDDGEEPPKLDPPEDEEQPEMPPMPEDLITPPEEDPTL
jgi:general secretion pathway protein I